MHLILSGTNSLLPKARVVKKEASVDDELKELESTEMYLTLFYAVLDPVEKRLMFANAGHPHAFIVHGDGNTTRLDATDPPVGFAGSDAYGQEDMFWDPATDLLFCFTDGLPDSLDPHGVESGEGRVVREVVAHDSPTEA